VVFVAFAHAPFSHAAFIDLQLNEPVAANGESVVLDIIVGGLGDFAPDSIGAFDISIDFDALALSFSSYALGGYLGDIGLTQALDSSFGDLGGSVNLAEVSLLAAAGLDALQPGEFILASLNFDVIDLPLGAPSVFSLAQGAILADTEGFALQTNSNASATLVGGAPVPIPGTLFLLLGGLFSWTFALRKRR
jgi:hypothetical protein